MVRIFSKIFHRLENVYSALYLVAIVSFLGYFLALVRNWLLAVFFGAGTDLDIYFAAFKIPDFLYIVTASFVSAFALVPIFEKKNTDITARI